MGERWRNGVIAGVAALLGALLFWVSQVSQPALSLEAQARQAVPLEVALSNGRPSLVEFYADWCTTCKAMAKDLASLKQIYGQQVNFVMLNVDNPRWLPEIIRFEVDGIPHFAYLDGAGVVQGEAIGLQPESILAKNLAGLVAGKGLDTSTAGRTSAVAPSLSSNQASPRSHGVP
ncbi:MAG: thioredoxin family protein [Gloeomargaritaceae cyanobacterium C42_A2020_066]|nr:thioredoxin family protein [Gloeomargaritaceae cyanobacterium C42_A2020_066]